MKYSNFYIKLIAVTIFGLAATVFACWANSPTIGAILIGISLCCVYAAGNLAPCDKYRKGYKKGKGCVEL
jgi:hypothetical protein